MRRDFQLLGLQDTLHLIPFLQPSLLLFPQAEEGGTSLLPNGDRGLVPEQGVWELLLLLGGVRILAHLGTARGLIATPHGLS